MDEAALERELQAVGRELADAFPSSLRAPLKAIDQKAMDLASEDEELRAALFRFVDVVPACRRRRRPRPAPLGLPRRDPGQAAARLGRPARRGHEAGPGRARSRVGDRRQAHGPPLHRRRVAPRGGADDARAVEGRRGDLGRPARGGDGHPGRGRPLRGAVPRRDRGDDHRQPAAGPSARSSSAMRPAPSPARTSRSRSRRSRPLLRPEAPARGMTDAAERMRPLLRQAKEQGAHLHIDMESLDSREAVLELVLSLLGEDEFRDGPERRHGAPGLPARLAVRRSTRCSTFTGRVPRTSPLTVRLVKGAYWDHEIVTAKQHGWTPPVFEDKADCDRNFEHADAPAARRPPAGPRGRRLAQPALGRARDRRQPPGRRRRQRPRDPGAARPRRRHAARAGRPRASGCGPTARSATSSRAWPTSCAGCSRTPRRTRSSPPRPRARRSRSCWPRREPRGLHQRADPRAAPVAARATGLAGALAELDARLPLRVAARIGGDERAGEGLVSTDPGDPDRVVALGADGHAPPTPPTR